MSVTVVLRVDDWGRLLRMARLGIDPLRAQAADGDAPSKAADVAQEFLSRWDAWEMRQAGRDLEMRELNWLIDLVTAGADTIDASDPLQWQAMDDKLESEKLLEQLRLERERARYNA